MTVDRKYRGAIVVAPPGAMGAWGLQMVRDAAAACSPSLEVRLLDCLDTVDLAVASQTIFATQFPGESVQLVLERGHITGSSIHPAMETTTPAGPWTFKNRPVARCSTRRMRTVQPKNGCHR